MKEHFAQPGDVGLIYTDEAGNYHILALSPEQHQALQLFVSDMTKDEPAVKADRFEVIIREKENPKLDLRYYGTSLGANGHFFWKITDNGHRLTGWQFNGWDILPFHIETVVPTENNAWTDYKVVTDKTGLATTYLAFFGSPQDDRVGSVSVFFSAGQHSEEDMIKAIKEAPICRMILQTVSEKWHYDKVRGKDYDRICKIIND